MTADGRWFQRLPVDGPVRLHLVCLPGAGGRIVPFRRWPHILPTGVEVCSVQLPGRGPRLWEPPERRVEPLARRIADAVMCQLEGPVALFGFSFGGLVGYEVACRLVSESRPPLHYAVAACRAPHAPYGGAPLHALDEDKFTETIQHWGTTPEEVLADPELRALVLPALRADLEAGETYVPSTDGKLPVPITAFAALSDPTVGLSEVAAWERWTSDRFFHHLVEGDHFVLERGEDRSIPEILGNILARSTANFSF